MTPKTYTAFCKEASGYGTTWIDVIEVVAELEVGFLRQLDDGVIGDKVDILKEAA